MAKPGRVLSSRCVCTNVLHLMFSIAKLPNLDAKKTLLGSLPFNFHGPRLKSMLKDISQGCFEQEILKGGSITVLLTSGLTGLESAV